MADIFEISFGTDVEKEIRLEKLRSSKAVEITGQEAPYSEDLREYRQNALEYGKTLRGEYINKDTGESIAISRSSIEEVLHHSTIEPGHIPSMVAIPQIIETSIYIHTLENKEKAKKPNIKNFDYYVAGLRIGGIDYTVKAVIANDANRKRYYDHALTQVEKAKLLDEINHQGASKDNFASSGLSSAGESGEAKQSRPATKDREATINSPASPRKDKRLLLILQAKSVKKIDGVELSPEQQKSLAAGEVVRVENAVNSAGEKQTVYVRWNTEKGNPDFFRSIPADSNKNRK
ncbi:MAG: DUF3945 domain-containing protein [Prevotellaceae bacterium]|jgi:hypothetical protein|nr:DUF3945 domain-containing protein [Prevotellaceae bacterium]